MIDHFEINIALNGKHLFATHERSITDTDKYNKVLAILKEKFPEDEGYQISATLWETRGKELEV